MNLSPWSAPIRVGTCAILFFISIRVPLSADTPSKPQLPQHVGKFGQERREFFTAETGLPSDDVRRVWCDAAGIPHVKTAAGTVAWGDGTWQPTDATPPALNLPPKLAQLLKNRTGANAVRVGQHWFVGDAQGLYRLDGDTLVPVFPQDATRRWAPSDVHLAVDANDKLWFASQQGAGSWDGKTWQLFAGADGLPVASLTSVACAADGRVWFASPRGAVCLHDEHWAYRQGKRWLPSDDVRDICTDARGNVWLATAAGLSRIYSQPMTLAEKAEFYQQRIDQFHRRTKFGYVVEAHAKQPGRLDDLRLYTNDNDGLWTSMYGAGECFAYGATKSPASRRRAQQAFDALEFLSLAPIGSPHEPPAGFIARSVLETDGNADPNQGSYSLAGQKRKQQHDDKLWRVYSPRWPKTADGKYYWKSDTSSDELDGHYFFYPLYYDLVAETPDERARVQRLVRANIEHLIKHDFSMHDHAGRTRWSVYGPRDLNHEMDWFEERGLKSLSILSYLNVAHHVTGDQRYRQVAAELREQHAFHSNVLWSKYQRGLGSGNQSDDEMAFMCFYNLIKYEPDADLRHRYLLSFANAWRQEEPEMNPFFNFCFAAVGLDARHSNQWGDFEIGPWDTWLADAVETLQRFPLDRFDWRHENRHRLDLVRLSNHAADALDNHVRGRGYRVNGKVIPVDERYFNHWNHDPWRLDTGGSGHRLGDGAVFTLPYYMGLYHGFIAVDDQ